MFQGWRLFQGWRHWHVKRSLPWFVTRLTLQKKKFIPRGCMTTCFDLKIHFTSRVTRAHRLKIVCGERRKHWKETNIANGLEYILAWFASSSKVFVLRLVVSYKCMNKSGASKIFIVVLMLHTVSNWLNGRKKLSLRFYLSVDLRQQIE